MSDLRPLYVSTEAKASPALVLRPLAGPELREADGVPAMSELRRVLLMEALEATFRFGFKASAQRLGWSEDEAWAQARERLQALVNKLEPVP